METTQSPRSREFQVDIAPHLSTPANFRIVGASQKVILPDPIGNQVFEDLAP